MIFAAKAVIATSAGEQIVLAVTHNNSPYISVYPWDQGFGSKFSDPVGLSNPGFGVTFNGTSEYIAFQLGAASPYIAAFAWGSSGFGSKFADPSVAPTNDSLKPGDDTKFNQVTDDLATAFSANPDVMVWPFSASGFGTKYSDPGTAVGGDGVGVDFTNDGNQIAVGSTTTPYCQAYAWSSGFGSKYANPASAINDPVYGVEFSLDDAYIATAQATSPYADVYAWNPGFGTAYNHPSGLSAANTVTFSKAVDAIAFGLASGLGSLVVAYPWSAGYGTAYAAPSPSITSQVVNVDFVPDDSGIAIAHFASPYISVYAWSPGFGTKYADPATLPNGVAYGCAFN